MSAPQENNWVNRAKQQGKDHKTTQQQKSEDAIEQAKLRAKNNKEIAKNLINECLSRLAPLLSDLREAQYEVDVVEESFDGLSRLKGLVRDDPSEDPEKVKIGLFGKLPDINPVGGGKIERQISRYVIPLRQVVEDLTAKEPDNTEQFHPAPEPKRHTPKIIVSIIDKEKDSWRKIEVWSCEVWEAIYNNSGFGKDFKSWLSDNKPLDKVGFMVDEKFSTRDDLEKTFQEIVEAWIVDTETRS